MNKERGFTLIELMVVILLIAAFVTIALPKIKTGTEINIKSAASSLTATIKYLYNEAVFKKNIYKLAFNIEESEYWIETLSGNEYVKSTDPYHRVRKLPNGVYFRDVVTERSIGRSALDDDEEFILFLPTGFVEPAVIHLKTDDEDKNYTLETKPYTGGTRVYNEYVELLRQ
jgi:prepilin-type N-terminal cleavage/methylation domain-containing protein